MYFCFCRNTDADPPGDARTPEQRRSPEHSPVRHGPGAADAARPRAASDDGIARRLSAALLAADDARSAGNATEHSCAGASACSGQHTREMVQRGSESCDAPAAAAGRRSAAASAANAVERLAGSLPRPRSANPDLPPRHSSGELRAQASQQPPAQQSAQQWQPQQPSGVAPRITGQHCGTSQPASQQQCSSALQPAVGQQQQGTQQPPERQHNNESQSDREHQPSKPSPAIPAPEWQQQPHNSGTSQPASEQRQPRGGARQQVAQPPSERLLVVKLLPARLDAQSEQFASELARHLGVPSPGCRILRKQVPPAVCQ